MVVVLALVAGCYADQPYQTFPEPQQVQGPPGGGMDPSYQQYEAQWQQPAQQQQYQQVPQQQGYDPASADPSADPNAAPAEDPSAQQYSDPAATAPVDDSEINQTLDGYGSWEEDPDYGRVWRPDATAVGVDFTPYETCGTWVWTTYGWTFTCDYGWGWLPFHYGQWAWLDGGYWGWVPGYTWSPAWCDWREGGGYIGWRPTEPFAHVRDHRHPDHQAHWRFAEQQNFAHPHIRSHLFKDPAEGLRATQPASHPGYHPTTAPVGVASIMRPRLSSPAFAQRFGSSAARATPARASAPVRPMPTGTWRAPQQSFQRPSPNDSVTWRPQPSYRAPQQSYRAPQQSYRAPVESYRPPVQTYRPPVQTYRPPVQTFHPSGGSFHPSSSWSAPSHSSFGGGGGGHSFGGGGGGHSFSGGGGGGHSFGGGGGGGHHR
jgi:hypothetical protein